MFFIKFFSVPKMKNRIPNIVKAIIDSQAVLLKSSPKKLLITAPIPELWAYKKHLMKDFLS